MRPNTLRVLFATPEAGPFVKTGGLGDVAGALPAALRALGADVRLLMPAYRGVAAKLGTTREIGQLPRTAGAPPARVLEGTAPNGVPVLLVDCPVFFDRLVKNAFILVCHTQVIMHLRVIRPELQCRLELVYCLIVEAPGLVCEPQVIKSLFVRWVQLYGDLEILYCFVYTTFVHKSESAIVIGKRYF